MGSSHDYATVEKKMADIGMKDIDILMIDGDHSINSVYKDWYYARHLANEGLVVMHDTNAHPGPVMLLKSIDKKVFDVYKYCNDIRDWGISVAVKKS